MNQELEQCCNDPWISCLEYKALNRKLPGLEKRTTSTRQHHYIND